jgi:hypothetical protein
MSCEVRRADSVPQKPGARVRDSESVCFALLLLSSLECEVLVPKDDLGDSFFRHMILSSKAANTRGTTRGYQITLSVIKCKSKYGFTSPIPQP